MCVLMCVCVCVLMCRAGRDTFLLLGASAQRRVPRRLQWCASCVHVCVCVVYVLQSLTLLPLAGRRVCVCVCAVALAAGMMISASLGLVWEGMDTAYIPGTCVIMCACARVRVSHSLTHSLTDRLLARRRLLRLPAGLASAAWLRAGRAEHHADQARAGQVRRPHGAAHEGAGRAEGHPHRKSFISSVYVCVFVCECVHVYVCV